MILSDIAARHREQPPTILDQFTGGGLTALAGTIRTLLERSRQRRALAELDDRLLDDIGVTRAQAQGEVAKSFWSAGKA